MTLELPANLLITGAALGAKLDDPKGRTSVLMKYFALDIEPESEGDSEEGGEGEEEPDTTVVLCSLTPDKVRFISQD